MKYISLLYLGVSAGSFSIELHLSHQFHKNKKTVKSFLVKLKSQMSILFCLNKLIILKRVNFVNHVLTSIKIFLRIITLCNIKTSKHALIKEQLIKNNTRVNVPI